MNEKIHFIAIGGSIMHNMAIALHKKGYKVTGSDDEVYEPSKSRLQKYDLLPKSNGWNTDLITTDLDVVILGMHARPNNPELLKAQTLGLKIYSFPEYIYEQSKDKQRVVIAGSHGKTSITSMIIHVLKHCKQSFDFAVGAQIDGFEEMVQLSDAPLIVIEGDEYLSSPIDRTPKFLKYHHHIGLLSGISWDHINVFPTEQEYIQQFELFADASPKSGSLIFCEADPRVVEVASKQRDSVSAIPYNTHEHVIKGGITYLVDNGNEFPIKIFGQHNLQNLNGAKTVLNAIGISNEQFYEAVQTFDGAANRLELAYKNDKCTVFKDFAHAPSKVRATTLAVKEQYTNRELIACLELHTFSSLTKEFLDQYEGCLKSADVPVVFFNPKTVEHKGLQTLSKDDIDIAFKVPNLTIFDNRDELIDYLRSFNWTDKNLLLMSSGNFDHLDYTRLGDMVNNRK